MKIREFLKEMNKRGFKKVTGYGAGQNLIKGDNKYFISNYEIICIYDFEYFLSKIGNFNFIPQNKEVLN